MTTVDTLGVLMTCQMFLDGRIKSSTLDFFKLIYPAFEGSPQLSITKMSDLNFMSPQAGSVHVHRLENLGYLTRTHYKGWALNSKQIVHPVLLLALKNGQEAFGT